MDRMKRYKTLDAGDEDEEGAPLVGLNGEAAEAAGGGSEDGEEDGVLQRRRAPTGVASASLLSRMLFLWVGPLLALGRTRQLDMADLFELPPESDVEHLARTFGEHLAAENARAEREAAEWGDLPGKRSLRERLGLPATFHALNATFGGAFIRAGFFKLGSDTLQFFPAVMLADYLQALSGRRSHILARMGSTNDAGCAAAYALALFFLPLARTLVEQAYFYRVQKINMGVKAALTTAVYRKSVRVSSASGGTTSTGEVLNLMQMDASRCAETVTYLHVCWSAALQTTGYITLLSMYIGWSVIGGLGAMFALVPIQSRVFRIIAVRRKAQMALSDRRVRMENELVGAGMRICKLNAWEAPMLAAINAVRDEELSVARNLAYINAFVSCLITTLPTLVAVSAFTLYSGVMHRPMVPWVVFPALSLFNQLRFPIMFLPRVLSMCADSLVSLKRLQRYTALPDSEAAAPQAGDAAPPPAAGGGDVLASIAGGSFSFTPPAAGGSGEAAPPPFLRDISLQLRRGTLTVVVGAVGSGKSALALALLGELAAVGPAPVLRGCVAYVAQSAWVQSLSLRDNILFGLPFDAERYAAAVEVACLGPDVALLPAGHDTEIGEKGITLSGGQRQRVALARAVYADADVVILDDPLSALDAHVGRAVFQNLVRGVLRPKAVLLITHALACATDADSVLVMDGGRIAEAGPPATLMAAGGVFAKLMAEHAEHQDEAKEEEAEAAVATLQAQPEAAANGAKPGGAASRAGEAAGKLIQVESRVEGSVKWEVYAAYARAFPGGWSTVALLLVLNVVKQLASIGTTFWLAVWSGHRVPGLGDGGYLGAYAGISIAVALVTYAKALAFVSAGLAAARELHGRLLRAVLFTRTSFFDVTPLGRILQRFSKDTDALDNTLNTSWNSTAEFMTGLATVLLTILIIEPATTPLLIPLGAVYFRVQAYFRSSYREIKRLDGTSGSPIYAHFSETLAGVVTVRAFGHQRRFTAENVARVGANQRAFYTQRCACDRWLPVRLETVGNGIVLVVGLLGVTAVDTPKAPFVGLVLSFALDLTGLLSWVIRQWSETEAAMVSVERVSEYAALPSEEDTAPRAAGAPLAEPPSSWPATGALQFDRLTLRYQPGMPRVLSDVSFSLAPGEKVGVVGRTGSGKSTLLVALWRLVEPESGRVLLDGRDTATLPLARLRAAITCIPQEPVLFSGTIRHNLDPVGEHAPSGAATDAALWDALEAVGMRAAISASGQGLDAQCAEFGAAFSAGERQLLSLARALLRHTRVVCLDEATASVDMQSDARMQAVIAQRFAACTVLTIAHRLHTIIGADRVLCMAAGQLAAAGSPAALLADGSSVFAKLVEESGEAAMLRAKAARSASAADLTALAAPQ